MDWRMVLVVAMGCLAGGCFHSDAHRSGYTDDGKFWQERVADHVRDDYINDLRDDILALGNEGEVDPDEAALLADTSVRYGMELAHQVVEVAGAERREGGAGTRDVAPAHRFRSARSRLRRRTGGGGSGRSASGTGAPERSASARSSS